MWNQAPSERRLYLILIEGLCPGVAATTSLTWLDLRHWLSFTNCRWKPSKVAWRKAWPVRRLGRLGIALAGDYGSNEERHLHSA